MEVISANHDPLIIGVIADSHIPDRVRRLHPALLKGLRRHKVDLILHGGDVSIRSVLAELEQVAPVRAVVGNRDLLIASDHSVTVTLKIHQTTLVLTHGHLDPGTYWRDKFEYITRGYSFERYQKRLQRAFPDADVIVYGHTHHAENLWLDGTLYFNPGSVSHGDYLDKGPRYGILKIYKDGRIDAQVIPLTGAHIEGKEWAEGS